MLYIFKYIDYNVQAIWVWRSLVARMNGVHEAGSSSLLTQTKKAHRHDVLLFFQKHIDVTCFFGLLRVFTPKNSFHKSCFSTQFYIVTHFSGTPFAQTEVAIIREKVKRLF